MYVLVEVLMSWWLLGQFPRVYYYRNKDGKEIDLLFVADETPAPSRSRNRQRRVANGAES